MGIIFDQTIYNKHRQFAITDPNEIKVGETYYSNGSHKSEIKVLELLTANELNAKQGFEPEENGDTPKWMITGPDYNHDYESIRDCGVTDHPYNAWLLFKTKELAEACAKELKVGYEREKWY